MKRVFEESIRFVYLNGFAVIHYHHAVAHEAHHT